MNNRRRTNRSAPKKSAGKTSPEAQQPNQTPSARVRVRERRRQEALARKRRQLIITVSAIVAGLVAIAGVMTAVVYAKQQTAASATSSGTGSSAATGRRIMPPWPVPSDPVDAAKAAGLRVGRTEYTVEHFHAHLDITINGKAVEVPPDIGIDTIGGQLSELHTHDDSGVLHIEAPTSDRTYTLGQAFGAWRIRLDANGIGGLSNNTTGSLRAYVDGKRITGDPAAIKLAAHEEIALVYGPRDAADRVPSSYAFPAGE